MEEPVTTEFRSWNVIDDHRLLYAVEQYVNTYGRVFEQDWNIIARFITEGDAGDEMRARYAVFRDKLGVTNLQEYSAYQSAVNKAAWIRERNMAKLSTIMQRQISWHMSKEDSRLVAKSVEEDLVLLTQDVHLETLLSPDLRNYLGGSKRISFMGYLNVVDKLLEKLPPAAFWLGWSWSPRWIVIDRDMRTLKTEFGESFDRSEMLSRAEAPTLTPNQTSMQQIDVKLVYRKKLDFDTVVKILAERGVFTLCKWRSIMRTGYVPIWFVAEFNSNVYSNRRAFQEHMASLGHPCIATMEELMMELCTYVLPTLWPHHLPTDGSMLPMPHGYYNRKWAVRWAFVIIYHSLTVISRQHVRKTIIYLMAVGVIDFARSTPSMWLNCFLREMFLLPCGECWNADPLEFEQVRERLKCEPGVLPEGCPWLGIGEGTPVDCIKGDNCWLKKRRSTKTSRKAEEQKLFVCT